MLLRAGVTAAPLARLRMSPGVIVSDAVRAAAAGALSGASGPSTAQAVVNALDAAAGGAGGSVAPDATPAEKLRAIALGAFLVTLPLSFPDDLQSPQTLKAMLVELLETQVGAARARRRRRGCRSHGRRCHRRPRLCASGARCRGWRASSRRHASCLSASCVRGPTVPRWRRS